MLQKQNSLLGLGTGLGVATAIDCLAGWAGIA